MAIVLADVEAAITTVQTDGQSVTIDGQSYTQANLGSLVTLRQSLLDDSGRNDGTRPTMRAVNFGSMGY